MLSHNKQFTSETVLGGGGGLGTQAHEHSKNVKVSRNHVTCTTICSLGEEPVKLSTEVPRQRFWLTFMFLLETISGLIIKIPLIQTKASLLWDLNYIFNNNQTSVAM